MIPIATLVLTTLFTSVSTAKVSVVKLSTKAFHALSSSTTFRILVVLSAVVCASAIPNISMSIDSRGQLNNLRVISTGEQAISPEAQRATTKLFKDLIPAEASELIASIQANEIHQERALLALLDSQTVSTTTTIETSQVFTLAKVKELVISQLQIALLKIDQIVAKLNSNESEGVDENYRDLRVKTKVSLKTAKFGSTWHSYQSLKNISTPQIDTWVQTGSSTRPFDEEL